MEITESSGRKTPSAIPAQADKVLLLEKYQCQLLISTFEASARTRVTLLFVRIQARFAQVGRCTEMTSWAAQGSGGQAVLKKSE